MKTMEINESLVLRCFFYVLKIPPATIFIVKPLVLLGLSLFVLPVCFAEGGPAVSPRPPNITKQVAISDRRRECLRLQEKAGVLRHGDLRFLLVVEPMSVASIPPSAAVCRTSARPFVTIRGRDGGDTCGHSSPVSSPEARWLLAACVRWMCVEWVRCA